MGLSMEKNVREKHTQSFLKTSNKLTMPSHVSPLLRHRATIPALRAGIKLTKASRMYGKEVSKVPTEVN